MKTKDQVRAERAGAAVASLKSDQIRDYAAEIRNFPALVMHNGLAPALSQLKAKGGPAKSALYEQLSSWISESTYGEPKSDLLSLLVKHPAAKLIRAQEEALAFAAWLKRFAESREPKARKA